MANVYSIDGVVPVVDPSAYIHPTAVLIGDVIIGADCFIGPGASLRGDTCRIDIGPGSNIQDNCVVHGFPEFNVVIESMGHIGHGAVLHGCILENNVMIGMNAVVMDGARIGDSAFVAAMAFVKAGFKVPPRTLVGGIPAKIMRDLSDEDIAWKTAGTHEYQAMAKRFVETLTPVDPLPAPEAGRPRLAVEGRAPLYKSKE